MVSSVKALVVNASPLLTVANKLSPLTLSYHLNCAPAVFVVAVNAALSPTHTSAFNDALSKIGIPEVIATSKRSMR